MKNHLFFTPVNICNYPGKQDFETDCSITLGDLHGNSLKLLFFLVYHGFFIMVQEDYDDFFVLFSRAPEEIEAETLTDFKRMLDDRVEVANEDNSIIFIGDMLADRMGNDWYTLLILQKLLTHKYNVKIILSNHDAEFIEAWQCYKDVGRLERITLGEDCFIQSMLNLQTFIDRGLVSFSSVSHIMQNCYLPVLQPLDFTVNADMTEITLYTHAPVSLEIVSALAAYFKIDVKIKGLENLCDLLVDIIEEFASLTVRPDFFSTWQGHGNPFWTLMWNRIEGDLFRPKRWQNFSLAYVNGHDTSDRHAQTFKNQTLNSHIFNVDNNLGKGGIFTFAGTYHFFRSEDFFDDYLAQSGSLRAESAEILAKDYAAEDSENDEENQAANRLSNRY